MPLAKLIDLPSRLARLPVVKDQSDKINNIRNHNSAQGVSAAYEIWRMGKLVFPAHRGTGFHPIKPILILDRNLYVRRDQTEWPAGLANSHCMISISMTNLSQEQEAAVRKYVRDFPGQVDSRIAMFGETRVGLTCLIFRLNSDAFWEGYDPTEDDHFSFVPTIEGKYIRFLGITSSPSSEWSAADWPRGYLSGYYMARHCEACIFVYDVTNRASFQALNWYHQNFNLERSIQGRGICGLDCNPCLPKPPFKGLFIVIANKIDHAKEEWAVSIQEAEDFCASIGAVFLQMSALTGEGSGRKALVDIAYETLWRRIQNTDRLEDWVTGRSPDGPRLPIGTLEKSHNANDVFWY